MEITTVHDALFEFYKYHNATSNQKKTCPRCSRPGTIFTAVKEQAPSHMHDMTHGEQMAFGSRVFTIQCKLENTADDPCIDIEFQYANRVLYSTLMDTLRQDIETLRNSIVELKHKTVYEYIDASEADAQFTHLSEILTRVSTSASRIMEKNMVVNENPQKAAQIKKWTTTFIAEQIPYFKKIMESYDKTKNLTTLNDAISYYLTELAPMSTQIRDMTYEYQTVVFNDPMCVLVQRRASYSNQVFYDESNDSFLRKDVAPVHAT